jgi:site-specific recombinase XerD
MARAYGEGSVLQRGEWWHIQYSYRGKVYKESARSRDKKVATKLLRRRLSEVAAGRHAPDAEKVTLADLRRLIEADHRLNQRRATRPVPRAFRHLDSYFGERARAVDITASKLTAYAAERSEDGAAAATVVYELSILSRCFNLAIRAGLLQTKPPFPQIRVQNARTGWVSDADISAIIKQLPEPLRAPIRFAYLTGWRLTSEVLTLTWAQVTADAVRLEPGTTKSGEGREWPLAAHPELAQIIEGQRAFTAAERERTGQIIKWVFHRNGGRQIRNIKEAWTRACRRAGRPGLLRHDLRRSAVRNLERAGVPRSVAMKLVGHKTESIYRRYAIVAPHDLAAGVEKLATWHAASASRVGGLGKKEA